MVVLKVSTLMGVGALLVQCFPTALLAHLTPHAHSAFQTAITLVLEFVLFALKL